MKTIIEAAGSYDDNIYIHLLHKFGYGDDSFDPISGINPRTHGSQLKQWIDSRNDPTKSIILLDWDRTITVIEGFIAFDYEKYAEYSQMQRSEYYNDFLRYLCGGDLRLFHIRELLDYAGERNIDVCILTNNNACDSDIFLELVNTLVPHSVENLFVACSLYEPFNGHKGLKLKSIEAFSDLCIMGQRAGFRRRSRRLRQRHGRKSRTKRGRFNKN